MQFFTPPILTNINGTQGNHSNNKQTRGMCQLNMTHPLVYFFNTISYQSPSPLRGLRRSKLRFGKCSSLRKS